MLTKTFKRARKIGPSCTGNWRTQRKNNTMRNCRRCEGSPKDSASDHLSADRAAVNRIASIPAFIPCWWGGGGVEARYGPADTCVISGPSPVCVRAGRVRVSNEPGAVSGRMTAAGGFCVGKRVFRTKSVLPAGSRSTNRGGGMVESPAESTQVSRGTF